MLVGLKPAPIAEPVGTSVLPRGKVQHPAVKMAIAMPKGGRAILDTGRGLPHHRST